MEFEEWSKLEAFDQVLLMMSFMQDWEEQIFNQRIINFLLRNTLQIQNATLVKPSLS